MAEPAPAGGDGERWFEDFTPGLVVQTPGATLSETQILDFAFKWDPQPFHIDALAAAESPYGGLIASGFHTLLVAFRLYIVAARCGGSSIGSPGIDRLRWLKPVRPGDTLSLRAEVLSARPSGSKPDRGFVALSAVASRRRPEAPDPEPVLDFEWTQMFLRRPA